MFKQRIKRFYRSLNLILDSHWSKRLFVVLLLLGSIISIVFHKAPVLVIFAFAAWTLLFSATSFLEASVDVLNRKLFSAVWALLWCGLLGGLSYLGWKLLIEEAF